MSMTRVGYVYDSMMEKHQHESNARHPENPSRIKVAYSMLQEAGLLNRCTQIPPRTATEDELRLVHKKEYIENVKSYSSKSKDDVCRIEEQWKTYTSDHTYEASISAVGCLLNVVDAIYDTKEIDDGVAIIRPPGHHAEIDESCGFCFFNNISIATKYAQKKYNVNKVLIVDWDIHHGTGIQHVFYDDPNVLYISLHRYDNGDYFPQLREANYNFVGDNKGEGFTVNIPWNKDKMGNVEYRDAFQQIVLPISRQFGPDLVFIASGFDAVAADVLGEYVLTPDMYGYMTRKLKEATGNTHMILALEGGYNPTAIGHSLTSCMQVLLDPPNVNATTAEHRKIGNGSTRRTPSNPTPLFGETCKRGQQTISAVVKTQSQYWNLL